MLRSPMHSHMFPSNRDSLETCIFNMLSCGYGIPVAYKMHALVGDSSRVRVPDWAKPQASYRISHPLLSHLQSPSISTFNFANGEWKRDAECYNKQFRGLMTSAVAVWQRKQKRKRKPRRTRTRNGSKGMLLNTWNDNENSR
jgi:hypothetical protein